MNHPLPVPRLVRWTSVALLGCAPRPSPPDASGARAPADVAVDTWIHDVGSDRGPPQNSLLADLPPIPSGGPPVGARPSRQTYPDDWASAWADRAAIRRRVADCDFQPREPEGPDGVGYPLHCDTGIYEQACVSDPCAEQVAAPCLRECGGRCRSCDTTCRAACSQCRASCRGPSCVLACATRCGACLQACIDAKDHWCPCCADVESDAARCGSGDRKATRTRSASAVPVPSPCSCGGERWLRRSTPVELHVTLKNSRSVSRDPGDACRKQGKSKRTRNRGELVVHILACRSRPLGEHQPLVLDRPRPNAFVLLGSEYEAIR